MALTISNLVRSSAGSQVRITGDLAFDSSYPTGGESLDAALLGLAYFESLEIKGMDAGFGFDCVVAAGGATASIKVFQASGQIAETITVTDNDNAATAGVALYVKTRDGVTAWLEFVSPTNADGTGTLANGGGKYFVFDSDTAATDGVALYFDEDAASSDSRFLCVSQSGQDLHYPVANGESIKFKHDASAASNGVQVYFDEDAANTYGRMLFVSPTNANGVGSTDTAWTGTVGESTEVPSGTSLVALTGVQFEALGR